MSNKKCVREKYLYLSARLSSMSARMLNREKAERLLDAQSFGEAAKLLTDFGYADVTGMSAKEIDAVLSEHRAAQFDDIYKVIPDKEIVDIFRIKYDYHNAKTIMKSEVRELDRADLLSKSGRVPPEVLLSDYNDDRFGHETDVFAKAVRDAKVTLSRTGNPQLADFVLDKAYFGELSAIAEKLGSKFLKGYVELMIDSANLRSAVRTIRMNKDTEFLRTTLVEGGSVGTGRILASASGDGLMSLFSTTALKKAAALGSEAASGGRMTAFELECDNAVTGYLKSAKLVAFGEAPVISYLASVENEITAVRMILTGFLAGIAPDTIRERLRDFYA